MTLVLIVLLVILGAELTFFAVALIGDALDRVFLEREYQRQERASEIAPRMTDDEAYRELLKDPRYDHRLPLVERWHRRAIGDGRYEMGQGG